MMRLNDSDIYWRKGLGKKMSPCLAVSPLSHQVSAVLEVDKNKLQTDEGNFHSLCNVARNSNECMEVNKMKI